MAGRFLQLGYSLLLPLIVLLAWQWAAQAGWVSAIVMPAPTSVARAIGASLRSGELLQDAAASLGRVLAGFALGTALALPLGLLMGMSALLHKILNPVLQVLRPIPPIAYIPMAIVWFGIGNAPAIFLITIGAFFPILLSTTTGVQHVDKIHVLAARNMGAGRYTLFWRIILPAASPAILNGMRVGIGTAFIVVIVAEMIAVQNGLGFRILEAREYMWSDKIIAGMLIIGLLGLAIDTCLAVTSRVLLRWHRGLH
ncbi:MAG: ABC transporter permease [Burkholderiales bacterium]|nr:MAG: ABC transporter permease [Burkholderiales bacterium]